MKEIPKLAAVVFIVFITFLLIIPKVTIHANATSSLAIPSTTPPDPNTHWYAGAQYPSSQAAQNASSVCASLQVPNSAPLSDDIYVVVLSAWDDNGSYDQIGLTAVNGSWGLSYSWTTGPPNYLTYHPDPTSSTYWNEMNLSLGATYTFNITMESGFAVFIAHNDTSLVFCYGAPTGGNYLILNYSYQGVYTGYSAYEEVWNTHIPGGYPGFNFCFCNQYWVSYTDGSINAATWTNTIRDSNTPSNVEVTTVNDFAYIYNTGPYAPPKVLSISTSGQGTVNPSVGDHTYSYGTNVSVRANANSGWILCDWWLDGTEYYRYAGSDTITVNMTANHSLIAYFIYNGNPGGGGCPYMSFWNGSGYVLDNNILPSSEISGGGDVKDYYRLEQPLVPVFQCTMASLYSLRISEFEHEHDYIDQVKLLAVDHAADVNVGVSPSGEILTYKNPAPPISAIGNDGANVLSVLNASDSSYYEGYNGSSVTLTFAVADVSAGAKLVMREDYPGNWKDPIYVQVLNSTGQWNTVTILCTRDNWATDAINLTGCLPDAQGSLSVRLYFTETSRIDYVGLDTTPQANVQLRQAWLLGAFSSSQGDVTRLLRADDGRYAELVPSQQILLTFLLPTSQSQRTFILYTEGHYTAMP